ncbi:MAG TPA: hypothetical protein VI386_17915 [Candidatus Sulfotelmatobacter sp.]
MIRNGNMGEFVACLRPATTVGTHKTVGATGIVDQISAPFAGTLSRFAACLGAMGTDGTGSPTQDIQVDIKINGTSIFTSAATSILWAHAGQVGTANTPSLPTTNGTLTTNPPTFNAGDLISLEVLQILNGTSPVPPTDLSCWLALSPSNQSPRPTKQGTSFN